VASLIPALKIRREGTNKDRARGEKPFKIYKILGRITVRNSGKS